MWTWPRCGPEAIEGTCEPGTSRSTPSRFRWPGGSDRSDRWDRRRRGPRAARRIRGQPSSGPAPAAPGLPARRRRSASTIESGTVELARAHAAHAGRPRGRAPVRRAAGHRRRARPAAGRPADGRARADRPWSCRSWRRFAESSRTRTTISTSSVTRSRCSRSGSASRRDLPASTEIRRARSRSSWRSRSPTSSLAGARSASAHSSTTWESRRRVRRDRGYVTFIGHDEVGARIIAGICRRLRTSRALSAHLQGLALHHLRLGFLIHQRPLSRRAVYDYLVATEPVSADVTLLTVADRLAARGEGPLASPEMVEAHLDLAREMLRDALAWHRDGPPRPPLSGDELADELGVSPGPGDGQAARGARAEAFAGRDQRPRAQAARA